MNAINFIKQHGVDKAREVVGGAPEKATVVSAETYGYFYKHQDSPMWGRVYRRKDGREWSWTRFVPIINPIELSDLKRLVESLDLVTAWGGLESTYSKFRYAQEHKNTYAANMIQQAIADYESIYSNDMGDDLHIENHVSPNCKVGVK